MRATRGFHASYPGVPCKVPGGSMQGTRGFHARYPGVPCMIPGVLSKDSRLLGRTLEGPARGGRGPLARDVLVTTRRSSGFRRLPCSLPLSSRVRCRSSGHVAMSPHLDKSTQPDAVALTPRSRLDVGGSGCFRPPPTPRARPDPGSGRGTLRHDGPGHQQSGTGNDCSDTQHVVALGHCVGMLYGATHSCF